MRKLLPVLVLIFAAPLLWAQWGVDDETEPAEPVKEKFRLKDRTVELSIANISFGFANNFIAAADIVKDPFSLLGNINDIIKDPVLAYKDPVKVNMNDFFSGFALHAGVDIKPVSLNFNWKNNWGFGLDIGHISVAGNVSLVEEVLKLQTGSASFGAGAAVFADVGIPVFFHYDEVKIKIRPAVYMPLVYVEPGIEYKRSDSGNGMRLDINYDMRIYTPFNLEKLQNDGIDAMMQDLMDNYEDILKNNLGYDFGLSLEYPWDPYLDIGVDIVNIPIPFAMAKLNHYAQLEGSAFVDTGQIDLNKIIDGDDDVWDDVFGFPDDTDLNYKYNSEGKKLYRPFTMLFYANYRPLDTRALSLIPSLGFSISNLYAKPASIEGGLSARFDSANIFITTLGVNYNDRKWKNSIDFALNLRAFELDLGLSMQSQSFVKSWQGAGLGVNFGLKLGW